MKWLLILPVLLTGCISGSITTTPDGCTAEFTSVFKSSEAISFCGVDVVNSREDVLWKLLEAR